MLNSMLLDKGGKAAKASVYRTGVTLGKMEEELLIMKEPWELKQQTDPMWPLSR